MKHKTVFLSRPIIVLSYSRNIPKLHSVNNLFTYCINLVLMYTIIPDIARPYLETLTAGINKQLCSGNIFSNPSGQHSHVSSKPNISNEDK